MFVNVSPGICLICLLNRVMTQSGFFFFAHSTRNTPTTIDSIGLLRLVIGKQQSTKSKNPKAKEKSKNKEIIMGSNGNIINNKKKAVIVSVVTATADNYGKVSSSITSSAKTESPQEIKKMKNKKKNNKKHKVQVSNTKKPLIFYLNLAKRYISECNEVELCGLGMAILTVVTIAKILKRNGFAIQKGIMTSTVLTAKEDKKGRLIEKVKG
ncbi:hypothetical protein REPUB_Repub14bG0074600 [Reevesia pubescens]